MFSEVLDLLPFAVFVHDRDGRLTFANTAAQVRGALHEWPAVDTAIREPGDRTRRDLRTGSDLLNRLR